jgi:putative spermidine/putrescine transport system permease protein
MDQLTTADGIPLKDSLYKAQSRAKYRAFFLVAPLLLFIVVTFIFPIGQMLYKSVNNTGFVENKNFGTGVTTPIMTNLTEWFEQNPLGTDPDEAAYAALAADFVVLRELRAPGQAGTRINYERSGARSMFTKAARRAEKLEAPFKEAIIEIDEDWADPAIWQAMRGASSALTLNFYLAAVDRKRADDGTVTMVPENRQVYVTLFQRTLLLSLIITGACFLLAFPVAHLLATLPMSKSNLLMILVLLPFWTSLLVRTTSWMVLLQSQGVVNDALVGTGILADENRIQMMYNQTGTIIAMVHILLPFMILPLYSVMRMIDPSYVRAARSMGATSWTAFRRIYFPQTVPGIGAGALLVFILSVGYYITPALVGGADGQLISNLIAFHMQKSLNWSLAAALAAILLASVLLLYWIYDRLIGIDNLKLG